MECYICIVLTLRKSQILSGSVKDPEALVRSLARAVIRRVQSEAPGYDALDLRERLRAANPFRRSDVEMAQVWAEEVERAVQSVRASLN